MCKSLFMATRNIRSAFRSPYKTEYLQYWYSIILHHISRFIGSDQKKFDKNISAAYANEKRKKMCIYTKLSIDTISNIWPEKPRRSRFEDIPKEEETLHRPENFYLGIQGFAKDSKKRVNVRPTAT